MRTIAQERAGHALERVNSLLRKPEEFRKLYRSYVDSLGPAIVMNGLGQALAVELSAAGSKSDNPHRAVYLNVQSWLCRADGVYPPAGDLLSAIIEHDEDLYLHAQAEALSWLEWHKKFCRAYLPAKDGTRE